MAQGDTDAVDSNGDLRITGGTLRITAQSAFDFDGTVTFTGGTVIVNGSEITTVTNSMMTGMPGETFGVENGQTPPEPSGYLQRCVFVPGLLAVHHGMGSV